MKTIKTAKASHKQIQDMIRISLFAVIIAICAWICIPTTIPFTMQTFGVFLTLSVLGGKRGTLAICIYLLLGIIGIPVYAGGTSGIGILFGNTGGYMVGWLFSGLVICAMEKFLEKKTWILVISMFLGLILCYAFGTFWYIAVYAKGTGQIGIWTAIMWCVVPYIIPDLIKIALVTVIQKRLTRFIK